MNGKTTALGIVLIMIISGTALGVGALLTASWSSPTINVVNRPAPQKVALVVTSDFKNETEIYNDETFSWIVYLNNTNTEPGYSWTASSLAISVYKDNTGIDPTDKANIASFQYSLDGGVNWLDALVLASPSAIYTIPLGSTTIPISTAYPIMLHATFIANGEYYMAGLAQYS